MSPPPRRGDSPRRPSAGPPLFSRGQSPSPRSAAAAARAVAARRLPLASIADASPRDGEGLGPWSGAVSTPRRSGSVKRATPRGLGHAPSSQNIVSAASHPLGTPRPEPAELRRETKTEDREQSFLSASMVSLASPQSQATSPSVMHVLLSEDNGYSSLGCDRRRPPATPLSCEAAASVDISQGSVYQDYEDCFDVVRKQVDEGAVEQQHERLLERIMLEGGSSTDDTFHPASAQHRQGKGSSCIAAFEAMLSRALRRQERRFEAKLGGLAEQVRDCKSRLDRVEQLLESGAGRGAAPATAEAGGVLLSGLPLDGEAMAEQLRVFGEAVWRDLGTQRRMITDQARDAGSRFGLLRSQVDEASRELKIIRATLAGPGLKEMAGSADKVGNAGSWDVRPRCDSFRSSAWSTEVPSETSMVSSPLPAISPGSDPDDARSPQLVAGLRDMPSTHGVL